MIVLDTKHTSELQYPSSVRETLLSANLRDFRQVPGLAVEDWLAES